jgi:hypothetical protein
MTDNNDPEKKIERAESTQDQEIIELEEEAFVSSQDDEEIIDLLEPVDEPGVENINEAVVTEEAEDITELEPDLLEEPNELYDELDEEASFDQALNDDFIDSMGMELDSKEGVSEDLLDSEKVSDAQMEAALERVIKKMFYEKIDGILVGVIEKTVTRELERLKSILLEDSAGSEK